MKRLSYSLPFLSLMLAIAAGLIIVASCTQEELLEPQEESGPAFEIVGEPVDVHLDISVGGLDASLTTRAEDDSTNELEESEAERQINDLWVFQYDATATEDADMKLIMIPQYLTITKQEQLVDLQVRLSNNDNNPSIIYVVTNTNSSDWVKYDSTTESYSGFMTLADLKANNIPTPEPQRLIYSNGTYVNYDEGNISIPMVGDSDEVVVANVETIPVIVERMFAKLCIKVDLSHFNTVDYNGALVYNVSVSNIPYYCTISSLWSEDSQESAGTYNSSVQWIVRTFSSDNATDDDDDVYPYVIYVPENIQGETGGTSDDKSKNIPKANYTSSTTDALAVIVNIDAITLGGATLGPYAFTAYPGGNSQDNFNIRRNCVYKVTMRIDNLNEEDLAVPSANCIVCLTGQTTAFFPYYRTETGGGYDFTDYLDYHYTYSEEENEIKYDSSKMINRVDIVWQSNKGGPWATEAGGFIGDNTDGKLVYIDDAPTVASVSNDEEGALSLSSKEYSRKICVTIPSGQVGNALVAAYNSDNKIIWSWHIWARNEADDPSNTGNGIRYFTYAWDSDKIYDKNSGVARIAGYTIMNCNLGALYDTPSVTNGVDTYGTLYEWGRKDPFPPAKQYLSPSENYSTDYIGTYYGNDGSTKITMTGEEDASYDFYSVAGNSRASVIGDTFDDSIIYSINNPTVFIAGTKLVRQCTTSSYTYVTSSSNYTNNGNWVIDSDEDHHNQLWGGLDPDTDPNVTKSYNTGLKDSSSGGYITLYDDYGEDKSIFDPCPYGWRVSPPDLWLGFTETGLNPGSFDEINYLNYSYNGFYMYMQQWREGDLSFFPCQGVLLADGSIFRAGTCGNYHNATTAANDLVNIIHFHNTIGTFKIFENGNYQIRVKSCGCPVRCVNTSSVSTSN